MKECQAYYALHAWQIPVIFQVLWKVYWQITWFDMAQYFSLYLHTAVKWTSTSLVSRHYSHTLSSKINPPTHTHDGIETKYLNLILTPF